MWVSFLLKETTTTQKWSNWESSPRPLDYEADSLATWLWYHTHSLTHTHTLVGGHSLILKEDKNMHSHTYTCTYIHMYHTYPVDMCGACVWILSTHMHTYTHMHKYTHAHIHTRIHAGFIQICRSHCDVYTMPKFHCDAHTNVQVPLWCIYNAQGLMGSN